MGYADIYWGITDEITDLLTNDIRLADIQEIVFGEKERIGALNFPCLFFIPGKNEIDDLTSLSQEHKFNYELVLILKDRDLQAGLKDAIDLAGDIHDVLMENRDLNGKCCDMSVTGIDPGYAKVEQNILHWVSIEIIVKVEIRFGF